MMKPAARLPYVENLQHLISKLWRVLPPSSWPQDEICIFFKLMYLCVLQSGDKDTKSCVFIYCSETFSLFWCLIGFVGLQFDKSYLLSSFPVSFKLAIDSFSPVTHSEVNSDCSVRTVFKKNKSLCYWATMLEFSQKNRKEMMAQRNHINQKEDHEIYVDLWTKIISHHQAAEKTCRNNNK